MSQPEADLPDEARGAACSSPDRQVGVNIPNKTNEARSSPVFSNASSSFQRRRASLAMFSRSVKTGSIAGEIKPLYDAFYSSFRSGEQYRQSFWFASSAEDPC